MSEIGHESMRGRYDGKIKHKRATTIGGQENPKLYLNTL